VKTIDYVVSGIDEGYFPLSYKGRKGKTPLVSVSFRGKEIVDMDFSLITVDGDDGSTVFRDLRKGEISILDGVIFAGFNYIEPEGRMVVFYRKKPHVELIEEALRKHFPQDQDRVRVIGSVLRNLTRVSTRAGDVMFYTSGITLDDARKIVEYYQVFSKIPEPLRVAHVIAKALSFFNLGCGLQH